MINDNDAIRLTKYSIQCAFIVIAMLACKCTNKTPYPTTQPNNIYRAECDTIFSIGGSDDAKAGIYLVAALKFDVGPDGLLWIVDPYMRDPRIHVFSENGTCIATLGTRGAGPGDLLDPYTVFAVEGGALTWDRQNSFITKWYVETGYAEVLRNDPIATNIDGLVTTEHGEIWAAITDYSHTALDTIYYNIAHIDSGGERRIYWNGGRPAAILRKSGYIMAESFPYGLRMCATRTGGLIFAPNHTYSIIHIDKIQGVEVFIQPTIGIIYSPEDIKYILEKTGVGDENTRIPNPLLPYRPDIVSITVSTTNDIWVATSQLNEDSSLRRYDVIDHTGTRQKSIWFPFNWYRVLVDQDRVFIQVRKLNGEQYIHALKLKLY